MGGRLTHSHVDFVTGCTCADVDGHLTGGRDVRRVMQGVDPAVAAGALDLHPVS